MIRGPHSWNENTPGHTSVTRIPSLLQSGSPFGCPGWHWKILAPRKQRATAILMLPLSVPLLQIEAISHSLSPLWAIMNWGRGGVSSCCLLQLSPLNQPPPIPQVPKQLAGLRTLPIPTSPAHCSAGRGFPASLLLQKL